MPIIENTLSKQERKELIAKRLREHLEAKKLSGIKFATVMKKQPSEISKWLSGTHNFTLDTLLDIEDVLGINLLNINPGQKQNTRTYIFPRPLNSKPGYTILDVFGSNNLAKTVLTRGICFHAKGMTAETKVK